MISVAEKNKGGRPPITTKDLPVGWKEIVYSMAAQGMSDVEIKVALSTSGTKRKIKFHPDLWKALQEREEEFSETIKIAKQLCEAWWLKEGRVNLRAKNFQTGLWYANMKNRFGWRDKHDVEAEIKFGLKELVEYVNRATKENSGSMARITNN